MCSAKKSKSLGQVAGGAAAAVWLVVANLLLCTPQAGAADVLYATSVKKQFPSGKTLKMEGNARGWAFRLDDCPCVAWPDASGIVRYIFVLPPEILPPEKREHRENAKSKAQDVAERLVEFLHDQDYDHAEMVPFGDRNGFAIAVSAPSSGNFACGIATHKALSILLARGGEISRLEDGEIDVKVPCACVDGDTCLIGLPLMQTDANVVSFVPGRSSRSPDKKVIEAARENLSCSDLVGVSAAQATELRKNTGAQKFIAKGARLCMVGYKSRCYIGSKSNIKNYIRAKSRSAGKIDFPKESCPLTVEAKTVKEDVTTSANAICRYLCNDTPVVSDDCAHIRMKGCRILIPLPDRNDSGRDEAIRYIHIRSDSRDEANSLRYAKMLAEMLLGPENKATISTFNQDPSVVRISLPTGTEVTDITSNSIAQILSNAEFADKVEHAWPTQTNKGVAISPEFEPLYDPESAEKKAAEAASAEAASAKKAPPSHEKALKDYIEHLRRLSK